MTGAGNGSYTAGMKTPTITVRVPPEITAQVDALAKRDGVKRSPKVVQYLREGVARDEREPKEKP